jgi:hypothetical protein
MQTGRVSAARLAFCPPNRRMHLRRRGGFQRKSSRPQVMRRVVRQRRDLNRSGQAQFHDSIDPAEA